MNERIEELLAANRYDSKDWRAGNYAERVEWLHLMYEDAKQEIERLSETLAQFDNEIYARSFKE
jgi:acyl-CoA reductase-like NAD-dependent aldehyde dehydrogenase